MWSTEFLVFFKLMVLICLMFFLNYFLSFLMFLELSFLLKILFLLLKTGFTLKKSVFLIFLITIAVGATIGLSLLVSESRNSSVIKLPKNLMGMTKF